jgi:hypothetical protein
MAHMAKNWTPMQWPKQWKDTSMLDVLKGTAITHLLMDNSPDLKQVATAAQQRGLKVAAPDDKIEGVFVTPGDWPGIKITDTGMVDRAAAGPTGSPWVDSNGWNVSLAAELNPDSDVWVTAQPVPPRVKKESYVIAFVDAAMHGARWIISLDETLAAGIAGKKTDAMATWNAITSAAAFFAAKKTWVDYRTDGVFGIVSDFAGDNETMGKEILNLLARAPQQYRILVKSRFEPASLSGIKAIVYADVQPPAAELKKAVADFVQGGGTLVTGSQWGAVPGASASKLEHPRFAISELGKGKIAVAKASLDDPWLLARDAQVILSHRNELLRFWNGGAVGASVRTSPDRKQSVTQMVFYGAVSGVGNPTVWIAGKYRKANYSTLEQPTPRSLPMEVQMNGVELQLPAVTQYAAVELEF